MSDPIRILLVDDQSLFREALSTLLSVNPEFVVVGEAGNGEEALRLAATEQPDVILMDLRMPLMGGVEATSRIRKSQPNIQVIILTTFDDDQDIFEGLRAGAVGYLMKDVSSEVLYNAIRSAIKGEYALAPKVTAKVIAEISKLPRQSGKLDPTLFESLTRREMEVLRNLATGSSNKEIAEQFFITEGTVKNHLSSIFGKLNVKDRNQAVARARDIGLLP